MRNLFERGLHNRNGFIRKGCVIALAPPKQLARTRARAIDFERRPPLLANSFPKSGTHLLDQILTALPHNRNFGAFLSSMTSSFRFSRRSVEECQSFLKKCVPGEIVRAHLFHDHAVEDTLNQSRFVHYFIYRDPRDVVLSEAHYYRTANRWHRLHPIFRTAPSLDDAISLAIRGIRDDSGRIYYPDVATRFRHYAPWIKARNVCAVAFEDLTSERRESTVLSMMEFYLKAAGGAADAGQLCQQALNNISPERSHTFRKGARGGWREAFSAAHRDEFKELAGELLIDFGFETGVDW